MDMVPLSAVFVPKMHSIVVLLPAPLAPIRPKTVPRFTDKLILSAAGVLL